MPAQYDQFVCPCCGQHAPVDRLMTDGPFELQQYRKTLGGKRKLTEAQRLDRKRKEAYRGSGPGLLEYASVKLSAKLRNLVTKRVQQLHDVFSPLDTGAENPVGETPHLPRREQHSSLI